MSILKMILASLKKNERLRECFFVIYSNVFRTNKNISWNNNSIRNDGGLIKRLI